MQSFTTELPQFFSLSDGTYSLPLKKTMANSTRFLGFKNLS